MFGVPVSLDLSETNGRVLSVANMAKMLKLRSLYQGLLVWEADDLVFSGGVERSSRDTWHHSQNPPNEWS